MMVEFSGMSDKESQQRRGRADGAVWSVADRIAVEENRALAPETAQESPWWPPVDRQPRCPGRDSVDSAVRCSLAGLARGVSASLDLLATAAGLGGAGPLAESLARISGRTQRTKTVAVERVFFGREFCSRQKRGAGVGKTKRGKGTKWMVVVDGQGLPLGNYLCSASPHEARLAETTLATIRVSRRTHGAAAAETAAPDRRSWLRQRPAANTAGGAWDRTDRAASLDSKQAGDPRWTSTATLSKTLENRAHLRVARQLPASGGSLRPLAHDLQRILSYRLLHDRLTEGFEIASSHSSRQKRHKNTPLVVSSSNRLH